MANDSWSGQDKAQHFIASAMLSAAGNEYSQHQGMSRDRSAMFGLMFSVSLGASKELWDSRPEGSGWSWKDFAWDIAGASTLQLPRLYRLPTDPSLKPHPFSFTVQC